MYQESLGWQLRIYSPALTFPAGGYPLERLHRPVPFLSKTIPCLPLSPPICRAGEIQDPGAHTDTHDRVVSVDGVVKGQRDEVCTE